MSKDKNIKAFEKALENNYNFQGVKSPSKADKNGAYHFQAGDNGVSFVPKKGTEYYTTLTKVDGKFQSIGRVNPELGTVFITPDNFDNLTKLREETNQPEAKVQGNGEWQLVKDIKTLKDMGGRHGVKETGVLKIISPDGDVTEYKYQSGPWQKGAIPLKEEYDFTTGNMENFIAKVGAIPQKGLRFSDSNFREEGRGGILIHEDRGVKGTIGCVGVDSKDWGDFYAKWESIPKSERPKEMVSAKDDIKKYANLDEDLIKNLQDGIKAENTTSQKMQLVSNYQEPDVSQGQSPT